MSLIDLIKLIFCSKLIISSADSSLNFITKIKLLNTNEEKKVGQNARKKKKTFHLKSTQAKIL